MTRDLLFVVALTAPAAAGGFCWGCQRPGRWGAGTAAILLGVTAVLYEAWAAMVVCCAWLVIAGLRWADATRPTLPWRRKQQQKPPPVPVSEQQRILADALERLATPGEVEEIVRQWRRGFEEAA